MVFSCYAYLPSHSKVPSNRKETEGHTVIIFDNQECEEGNFIKLIRNPPNWTNSYYTSNKTPICFDQIIDVPYFVDSKYVISIQIADLLTYLLRKYIEFKMNVCTEEYEGERSQIEDWVNSILELSIPKSNIYLKIGRCECADLFYRYAPSCISEII
jgi:hypothetical protein